MTHIKSLACIFLLGALWGPSFLFIKVALEGGIPPLSIAALRVGIAAVFLWMFIGLRGIALPTSSKTYLHAAVIAIFSLALPFALINIAEQYIDSALAGIINGLTPIATTLLAHLLIHDEKLNRNRMIGITLGVIGFLLLLLPTLLTKEILADTLSIIGVGIAALSYAVGIIYGRIFLHTTRTLALPALQVSFAALYLIPVALFFEGMIPISNISQGAWISVILLAFLGTACAFIVYFHILQHYGAVALSTSVFLLPIFAIIFGVIFLGESLSWIIYAGTLLILSGMKLVHGKK
jgi:drug/metabolite transporter (DMT)-like permease